MITTWVITLVTLFLGLLTGYYIRAPEEVKRRIKNAQRKLKGTQLGPVDNISALEEYKEETGIKEEEEEMEKVIENVL